MTKLFNISGPSIIAAKDGSILMCNENFELMIIDRMATKAPPSNILTFISGDSEARSKLAETITKVYGS